MAKRSGLSPSTIGRIRRRFDLKPHLVDGFTLSTDPLCVDEKSPFVWKKTAEEILDSLAKYIERISGGGH